jgi:hypothetical protein
MASNVELLYTYLFADATLVGTHGVSGYSGILRGGLWKRPLKQNGFGATPEAFTNGSKGDILMPAAVILDLGDGEHPQQREIPTAYTALPLIYFYAPATDSGKTAIRNAQERVYDLLKDYVFVTENGPLAFVRYVDRVGILDSEEFIGCVFDYCRYEITSRKRSAI